MASIYYPDIIYGSLRQTDFYKKQAGRTRRNEYICMLWQDLT